MQRYEIQAVTIARPGQVVVNRRGIGIAVEDRNDHRHVFSLGRRERLLAKDMYRRWPKQTVAATTITGDTPCYATNVVYRLDTPGARDFLRPFVTLP